MSWKAVPFRLRERARSDSGIDLGKAALNTRSPELFRSTLTADHKSLERHTLGLVFRVGLLNETPLGIVIRHASGWLTWSGLAS
jgi:hypothetical protein